jgi:hypothetical protein
MSYRSTTLIAIVVFGILFSLLYSSSFFANQSAEKTYQLLASKRAELDVYRLRTPEDLCFKLEDQKIKEIDEGITVSQNQEEGDGDTLSMAMRDADSSAQSDQQMEEQLKPSKEYFEQMGNRYTGRGLYFEEGKAIVPLVKAYESVFNHTVNHKVTRGYSDDVHQYSCNFSYNGNYYGLGMKFYSLRFLNIYSGFTSISIPNGRVLGDGSITSGAPPSVDDTVIRAIYPFNDTILWSNHSHNPVTLQIRYKTIDGSGAGTGEGKSMNTSRKDVTIYPNESHDEFLNNYYDSADGVFNFTIREYPAIQGKIVVDHYPVCSLDMQQIKTLYKHSLYPIKLPVHTPAGYNTTICMLADRGEVQLFFWNKKLPDDKMGQPGGFQDPVSNVEDGAIMIYEKFDKILFGDAYTPTNATQRALELYNQISNATSSGISLLNGGPQLIPINSHMLAVGTGQITEERQEEFAEQYTSSAGQHAPYIPVGPYYRPSRLVIFYTDIAEEPVGVTLVGKVPLDDLVEIAKSLH